MYRPFFTENQSIKLFPLYFGVSSCRCETYPIDFISLSKTLGCQSYRCKNRVELLVLNGNKRPIRFEFHNGVKPTRNNGNIVHTKRAKTKVQQNIQF